VRSEILRPSSSATIAMTGSAVIGKNRGTLIGRATARGQPRPTGLGINVPGRKVGRTDRLAEVRARAEYRAGGKREGEQRG